MKRKGLIAITVSVLLVAVGIGLVLGGVLPLSTAGSGHGLLYNVKYCGDGTCGIGEKWEWCPIDCATVATCGDGICTPLAGENDINSPKYCSNDCSIVPYCGDKACQGGRGGIENEKCPQDCTGITQENGYCGDTICGCRTYAPIGQPPITKCPPVAETISNCPLDCSLHNSLGWCGNGKCEAGENWKNCPRIDRNRNYDFGEKSPAINDPLQWYVGDCYSECGDGVCGEVINDLGFDLEGGCISEPHGPGRRCKQVGGLFIYACEQDCGICKDVNRCWLDVGGPPAKWTSVCGNGICEVGDNYITGCPPGDCGDGVLDFIGEIQISPPCSDCLIKPDPKAYALYDYWGIPPTYHPAVCGNGICEGPISGGVENPYTCPQDCVGAGFCGDTVCQPEAPHYESSTNCPVDCKVVPYCGDGVCGNGETQANCPADCGGVPPGDNTIPLMAVIGGIVGVIGSVGVLIITMI